MAFTRKTDNIDDVMAADINELQAAIEEIQASFKPIIPAARVYTTTSTSIPNTEDTAINFNSVVYDTDNIFDPITYSKRLFCRTAGLYHIYGQVSWGTNATGDRILHLRLNGSTLITTVRRAASGSNNWMIISTDYPMAVNDYFELVVYQNSGAALAVVSIGERTPVFGMTYQGKVA